MTQNFFIPALNFLKRIHVPGFNLGTFSKYPWFKIRTQFSASKSDVFDGHTDRDTGPQCHHIDLKPWCHISLVWRQRARCHRPGPCLIYWDDTLICTVPVILTPGSLAQTSALNQMIIRISLFCSFFYRLNMCFQHFQSKICINSSSLFSEIQKLTLCLFFGNIDNLFMLNYIKYEKLCVMSQRIYRPSFSFCL